MSGQIRIMIYSRLSCEQEQLKKRQERKSQAHHRRMTMQWMSGKKNTFKQVEEKEQLGMMAFFRKFLWDKLERE